MPVLTNVTNRRGVKKHFKKHEISSKWRLFEKTLTSSNSPFCVYNFNKIASFVFEVRDRASVYFTEFN